MNIKNIKKYIIWLSITFALLFLVNNTFAAKDIMEVMFQPAKSFEKIIDLWNTKDAVGNEVFRESQQLWLEININNYCMANGQKIMDKEIEAQVKANGGTWSNEEYCKKILWWNYETKVFNGTESKQAPLLVRITKFLLRMTIVLAITMVLYNGVMWIVESAKWWEVKDAKDNLILIIGWVLLALSSVWLINLISSITISSLGNKEAVSYIGCRIDNQTISRWDELKQYVCEKAFNWKRYPDRIWNRCRVDYTTKWFDWWYWSAITETEQESKCVDLWWIFTK